MLGEAVRSVADPEGGRKTAGGRRDAGNTVAEGWHRGAGSPHAEADALRQAGAAARGTTAVVTLEPCNHTGRTGPCAGCLLYTSPSPRD